jgi:hypothetical protein
MKRMRGRRLERTAKNSGMQRRALKRLLAQPYESPREA